MADQILRVRECSGCQHFRVRDGLGMGRNNKPFGECHRGPATCHVFMTQNRLGQAAMQKVGEWPPVATNELCGEYAVRDALADTKGAA